MGCSQAKDTASGGRKEPAAAQDAAPHKGGHSAAQVDAEKLLSDYTLGDILGQGAFGIVYACKKLNGREFDYAVKMVDKVETPMTEIKKEAQMLQKLEHPNVVRIHDVYYERFFVCIVMDRYHGGDLIEGMQAHWKTRGKIPVAKTVNLAKQMLTSVAHLHNNNVVHRDVKGDNYLTDRKDIVDPQCRVIMSDFGTAVSISASQRLQQSCGTKVYWAPEFWRLDYSFKVDDWALGVVMYGLLDGRFPFKGEHDVKEKQVKLSSSIPPNCVDFVKKLLDKSEANRMTSAQGLQHAFIGSDLGEGGNHVGGGDEKPPDLIKEMGANAGQDQRRKELVDRLNERAKKPTDAEKQKMAAIAYQPRFEVVDKVTKRVVRYEWWSPAQVEKENVINLEAASAANALDSSPENSVDVISKMLIEHDIDYSTWGTGQNKTLDEFAAEVQHGEAVLMLDASQHRKLVRVVDVVCVRLLTESGAERQYLCEFSETFADGRHRDLKRLPASKKEPHENTRRCAQRILTEIMGLGTSDVRMNFSGKETFEEETESVSYPGVMTVYRKEIVEGVLSSGAKVLAGGPTPFSHKDGAHVTKRFGWCTEAVCAKDGIKLRAPAEEEQISGLVQAPVGFTEEELRAYLVSNNVDVDQLLVKNPRSLQEFSTELIKGEATLMTRPDGTVIRIVDVALLYLVKPETKEVLVESEERIQGQQIKLSRLPGTKRRPDENQFLTAQRFLKKNLKMDENSVHLNNMDVKVLEEEKDSAAYPGVRTLYRKRIIKADLQPLPAR